MTIDEYIDGIEYLAPNEPITIQAVKRILTQIKNGLEVLEDEIGTLANTTIEIWNSSVTYSKGDIVLYMKTESTQVSADVGLRTFVYLLISTKDNNTSIPNYDMIQNIPDFSKSNWNLLNPMSYLLQDIIGLKAVVKEVFNSLMLTHLNEEHQLVGSAQIDANLVKKDFSNLETELAVDKQSIIISDEDQGTPTTDIISSNLEKDSDGTMKYSIKYKFNAVANQQIVIDNKRYYWEKSPIWDESDKTIFSHKYIEDDLFSVEVNDNTFANLRFGTNIFNAEITFDTPFLNDEYCVFFDTYGRGQFVFGYGIADIEKQTEPTYDAIVSMPMLLNKTAKGFNIVLPIHTYFNSIQRFQVGVPWKNEFTLQAIGRYR